jgi:hypothetical protein
MAILWIGGFKAKPENFPCLGYEIFNMLNSLVKMKCFLERGNML